MHRVLRVVRGKAGLKRMGKVGGMLRSDPVKVKPYPRQQFMTAREKDGVKPKSGGFPPG
jgi:hypothetical protein